MGFNFQTCATFTPTQGLPIEDNITADFIGGIGAPFFEGHLAKLDYSAPSVTFYRATADGRGRQAAEAGEHVVGTIQLGSHDVQNLPVFAIAAGQQTLVGGLDTGSRNHAWLSDEEISALKSEGVLTKQPDGSFMATDLVVSGIALPPMPLHISIGRPPFAELLPEPDAPYLQLGYEFLSRYKTIWDYGQGSLTVLAL